MLLPFRLSDGGELGSGQGSIAPRIRAIASPRQAPGATVTGWRSTAFKGDSKFADKLASSISLGEKVLLINFSNTFSPQPDD
jgi:hypothetical protein